MNLNQVVQEQLNIAITDKLPELINQKVQKLLDDILSDLFRSYSDTGKAIKEKIEKQLDVSLQHLDLTDYNVMVSKAIANQLSKQIDIKPIEELVKSIVGRLEYTTISLGELIEKVKELAKDDAYFHDESAGEILLDVDFDDKHDWYVIKLGLEEGSQENVKFYVTNTTNTILALKYSNFFKTDKEVSTSDLTNMSALENLIFQLYNNNVKITEIEDNVFYDLCWSKYED